MLLLALLACRPPEAPPDPLGLVARRGVFDHPVPAPGLKRLSSGVLSQRYGDWAATLPDPVPDGAHALPRRSESPIAAMAGDDITGARFDPDIGARLMDLYDALPPLRKRLGIAGFTGDVQGSEICESPLIVDDFSYDGEDWTARYMGLSWINLLEDPKEWGWAITDACKAALADNGGDIDAAVASGACTDEERYTFFGKEGEEDTDPCRQCIEVDGDWDRCEDAGVCESPKWAQFYLTGDDGGRDYWYVLHTTVLACAPDWTAETFVLVQPVDGDLPRPFDAVNWGYWCFPSYDESIGDAEFSCFEGETGPRGGNALGEGFDTYVWDIRRQGETLDEGVLPWHGRSALASRVLLEDGGEIRWFQAIEGGDGSVSLGSEFGGYGIDPYALKPGGTDVADPTQTYAHEWWATVSMKHSTTRNGIVISPVFKNKCAPEGWVGPDAEGRYKCVSPRPTPIPAQEFGDLWDDESSFTYTNEQGPWFPLGPATLATSGRPDLSIPGGLVAYMAGSDTIGDADWDACVYPDTFVPDVMPTSDLAFPLEAATARALTIETFRFDKPENTAGVIATVRTDEARGFCPAGPDGTGFYSGFEITTE